MTGSGTWDESLCQWENLLIGHYKKVRSPHNPKLSIDFFLFQNYCPCQELRGVFYTTAITSTIIGTDHILPYLHQQNVFLQHCVARVRQPIWPCLSLLASAIIGRHLTNAASGFWREPHSQNHPVHRMILEQEGKLKVNQQYCRIYYSLVLVTAAPSQSCQTNNDPGCMCAIKVPAATTKTEVVPRIVNSSVIHSCSLHSGTARNMIGI